MASRNSGDRQRIQSVLQTEDDGSGIRLKEDARPLNSPGRLSSRLTQRLEGGALLWRELQLRSSSLEPHPVLRVVYQPVNSLLALQRCCTTILESICFGCQNDCRQSPVGPLCIDHERQLCGCFEEKNCGLNELCCGGACTPVDDSHCGDCAIACGPGYGGPHCDTFAWQVLLHLEHGMRRLRQRHLPRYRHRGPLPVDEFSPRESVSAAPRTEAR
jgi:hypothetical protein